MKVIFDLEMHSRFARAVSKEMNPHSIASWAVKKGIDVIVTGDITHPLWFQELRENLEEAEPGLFKLRKPKSKKEGRVRFLLSGEVSCVYTKNGKGRRIHNLIYAPSFEVARQINIELSKIGNLKSDGRPILGLDSKRLLQILLDISPEAYLIPAHVWTPWFGLFGSKSGFNSLTECFDELAEHIFAVETGLSSDPKMNWRIPFLDNISFVSGSDAHSLPKIGREATVLNIEKLSYQSIFDAIKLRNPKKFLYTIEFFPEEGKYHFDGHRDVRHSQSPEQTRAAGGKCMQCGASVTVGVMSRIQELADRSRGDDYAPAGKIPFKNLIPLQEIIAETFGVGTASKRVSKEYEKMIEELGSEFHILLDAKKDELRSHALPAIADAILWVREGKVSILPGYDGEYGKIKITG